MVTDNFVCFACRKAFAKAQIFRPTPMEKPPQACPDCGGVLSFTGPKYQPPRRNAIRQWALDRALLDAGQLARSPRYAYGVPASDKVHTLRELHAAQSKRK
jgi:DNA-directed RNA polymerase subunit RPC12/RpoP